MQAGSSNAGLHHADNPWELACRTVQCCVQAASTSMSESVAHMQREARQRWQICSRRIGASGDHFVSQLTARRPLFAAVSVDGKKKRGKKAETPEERQQLQEAIESLSPEERDALENVAWKSLLKSKKVTYEGRKMTMLDLAKELEEEKRLQDAGGNEPTIRDKPRWQQEEEVSSLDIRPGATKMMLRPEEQATLPLDQLGVGHVFQPRTIFGVPVLRKRDFSFGLYGNAHVVKEVMEDDWAGQDPAQVLKDEGFYQDIILHAPAMELTLMAKPARDLPLAEVCGAIEPRLRERLAQLGDGGRMDPEDETALKGFLTAFDEKRMKDSGLYEKGAVKEGAHIIFTAGSEGQLSAEAITPGILRDRRAAFVGTFPNNHLTWAVFDMFLGSNPIDEQAKQTVGQTCCYLANGFKLEPNPENPNQHFVQSAETPFTKPLGEELPAVPELFSIEEDAEADGGRRMLVKNVRGLRRVMRKLQQREAGVDGGPQDEE